MKKLIALAAVAFALAPLWAKKASAVLPDEYDEPAAESIAESSEETEDGDPYSKEKMKPKGERNFGEKLLGLGRFRQVDSFSLFAKSSVGTLHLKKKASLIYREGTDIGGFYCYYDTSAFAVQFGQKARATLVSAVSQYLADFDAKRLDRGAKQRRTEAVYGTAEAYEEYGIALANLNHAARPKVCFGYEFIKGSPYFAIYVKKAKDLKYEKRTGDDTRMGESIAQRYYFTRAQASRLAEFLSDENIDSLRAGDAGEAFEDVPPDNYAAE